MGRLIDAFELMRSMGFYDDCAYCDCDKLECEYDRIYTKQDICDFVESHIFNAPAIDAVPVVRCKDCVSYGTSIGGVPCEGYCKQLEYTTRKDDDFCSWGRRKNEAD